MKKKASKTNTSRSIKFKITLLCTLFISIAVFTNYIILIYQAKATITTNTQNNMLDLADSYSQNVTNTVNKISQSTEFMLNSDAISSFIKSGGTENATEAQNFISMFSNMNSDSEEINLVSADGIVLLSSNEANKGKDISNETYFTELSSDQSTTSEGGMQQNGTQSGVFISDTTGNACITFAVPIRGGSPEDLPADMAENTQSSDSNNTSNTSSDSAEQMPQDIKFSGAITMNIKVSALSSALSDITVKNSKSSYAYLLDSTGTVIYHPENENIGQKLDIQQVSDLVKKIGAGNIPESDIISYTLNGEEKLASFTVDKQNNWLLVIVADKSEILSSLSDLSRITLIISIAIILILTILVYLFAGTITNPIKKITMLINKTANLDLSPDNTFDYLSYKKDETGEMSRSIHKMREVLHKMILQIEEASRNINGSADNLNIIINQVNDHVSDNSATAEELSASMQETASTTEVINLNIQQIGMSSGDITNKANDGTLISKSLIERAIQLKTSTSEATEKTKQIFETVKAQTDLAIEKSKAVDKINILTNTIKEIADQTSLLSLNASIEAARAGEAGRGFAVVASEIGSLADQSAHTVSNINEITNEVHQAVTNLTESLEKTLEFLEKNVLVDYQDFMEASEHYNQDAVIVNDAMSGINTQIKETNDSLIAISNSVSEINNMISEAANGVNDVAEKNTDIVVLTSQTQDMVKSNADNVINLKEIVDQFKL